MVKFVMHNKNKKPNKITFTISEGGMIPPQ